MALTGSLAFRTTAPRARAMYRPPTWRLAFIRLGTPLQPEGRRHACSRARRRRRAGPIAEGSSSGQSRCSAGSCTGCRRVRESQRGYRRPPGVARQPSDGLSGRRRALHSHLRLVASRHRASESPGMYRLPRRSGSVRDWKTLWLFGLEGKGLTSVPSLG